MQEAKDMKTISIRDYISIIFRRKGVIITVFLIMMLTVSFGLELNTPVYEAKVKMLILATKQIESPYYKETTYSHFTEMTLTQSEIVKSNPVIERVVKVLRLNELPLDYEKGFCSPLKSIFVDLRLKMFNARLSRLPPKTQEQVIFNKAVRGLKERVRVEPVKDTSLFTITVTDYSPEAAAKLANSVSRSYCIFDFEQQLSELQQKYGQKHISIMQLKAEIESMRSQLTKGSLTDFEAIGPASVKVIEQASVPIEPVGARKMLILLTTLIFSLILGFIMAFWAELLDSTVKTPQDISSLGLKPLGYIPQKNHFLGALLLLIRRVLIITCLAFCFLIILRVSASIMGIDQENPIIKFIYAFTDPALFFINILPLVRKLSINIIFAVIFFIALSLNIFLTRLLSHLAEKINCRRVVIKSGKNGFLLTDKNISEQVYLSMREKGCKVALVTSVLPSPDITAITANLGLYLSKAGHSVLIIDANLRKPSLHKILKTDNHNGLAGILSAKVTFADAVFDCGSGLHLMPTGGAKTETLDLAGSSRIEEVARQARAKFELIFIICPDLKNFHDSALLSSCADGIILIVNEGRVKREVLKAAIGPLEQKKKDFFGVILNNRTFAIPKLIYERI